VILSRLLTARLAELPVPALTTLLVKLKGSPEHITVSAASWEHDAPNGDLIGKDANGKVIARFVGKELAGWWPDPVNESLAERLAAARRRRQEAP
jgi:hypothetical protein